MGPCKSNHPVLALSMTKKSERARESERARDSGYGYTEFIAFANGGLLFGSWGSYLRFPQMPGILHGEGTIQSEDSRIVTPL